MNAIWLVLAASGIAAYTDITRRKIPNALVAAVLVCGISLQALHGPAAALTSLLVFTAAFAFGTIAFSWGIAGGGDVKFLAAAGAALGWPYAFPFFLYTILAGGLLSIAIAMHRRTLRSTAVNIGVISLSILSGVRPKPHRSQATDMPYAVAIFAGAAMALWANQPALHLLRFQ